MEKKLLRGLIFDFIKSQFIAVILSVMSLPLMAVISANYFKFIYSIFCFLLLLLITYSSAWRSGWSDPNRVNLGQIRYNPYKGLIACLSVCGIWIIISLLNIFINNTILKWIIEGFNFYLIGFFAYFGHTGISTFIIITIADIIWAFIAFSGYILGYKRISLGFKILYVNPDKKNKKKRH